MGVVSSILHFDRFHLNSASLVTQIVTYFWLIPYGVGWLMAVLVTVHQIRQPGGDPPREKPLPSWLRLVLVVQAAVLLIVGLSLFISPETATTLWPWALTSTYRPSHGSLARWAGSRSRADGLGERLWTLLRCGGQLHIFQRARACCAATLSESGELGERTGMDISSVPVELPGYRLVHLARTGLRPSRQKRTEHPATVSA